MVMRWAGTRCSTADDAWGLFLSTTCSCVHDLAGVSDRNIGSQLTEAVAGLDRTLEILDEMDEDSDPDAR